MKLKNTLTWVGIILMLVVTIAMAAALECTSNNDFIIGDDVNICTDGCIYQTEVDMTTYFVCDSSVKCKLTAFYPNNSIIVESVNMTRNGSIFNYDLGDKLGIGIYRAVLECNRLKGFYTTDFSFTVSETPTAQTSGYSPYTNNPSSLDSIEVNYKDMLFNFNNKIYVKTLDKYGQIINVQNISIQILSNINYTSSYKKLDNGFYEISLEVPKQNTSITNLKVTAITLDKTLSKTETLSFKEKSFSLMTGSYLFNIENSGKYAFIITNSSYILYGLCLFLLILFIYIFYKFKKQK